MSKAPEAPERRADRELPAALEKTSNLLRSIGQPAEVSCDLLGAVTDSPATQDSIRALRATASIAEGDDSVERLLLWHAAHRALSLVDQLPVHAAVRGLLEKELHPLPAPNTPYNVGSYMFAWAARIATLRRFPAGPMDWEISGIPRSWLLKPPARDLLRLASLVAIELRGTHPCFFMHVAPRPRNRALVLEKEVIRAYYRMARSLEVQPAMKAIIAAAWFYDPVALRDNPHLEYLHRPLRENGGVLTTIGPARADAGFMEGNAKRRQQYEAGELQYRIGLAIWPRRAAIDWAARHPELDG